MRITNIIPATVEAVDSASITVTKNTPVTILMHGVIAALEPCALEMQLADGTWQALLSADAIFTDTLNAIQVSAVGSYRIAKEATVGLVGFTTHQVNSSRQ